MSKREREIIDLIINSGSCELDKAIKTWLTWDRNKKTLCEIQEMIDNQDWDTLRARLYNRICFGTAGLRGRMRAGFDSMNELTVIQTAQGLVHVVLNEFAISELSRGVVIGYDGRHNSKRFAELSAAAFVRHEIPVHLFSEMVPTPFVPFTIQKKKCLMGVMVTASHNPKEDNGYKVYWDNATQVIAPTDIRIQQAILEHLEPERKAFSASILKDNKWVSDPYEAMFKAYYRALSFTIPQGMKKANAESGLRIVYTAMHGVGYPYVEEAFSVAKLPPLVPVEEQKLADPDFPTLENPNPEEGKSALQLAIQKADAEGIRLILANDPDADRLACAEKDEGTGKWKIFTGNELGALLGWWAMDVHIKLSPDAYLGNCYMIASTVSSKILRSMAEVEHFNFEETLTGFKWMGNRATELMSENKTVLFAFEEAIGYMLGTNVIDKDGISAAFHLATMAVQLATERKSLNKHLTEMYEKYGYHCTKNAAVVCEDTDVINRIFYRLRFFQDNMMYTYPTGILNEEFRIASVRDLTLGYDSAQEDHKSTFPRSPGTQMITFYFTNGLCITLRTSGTEPKIKIYSEMCTKPGVTNWEEIRALLCRMFDAVVEEFLEPEANNLVYHGEVEQEAEEQPTEDVAEEEIASNANDEDLPNFIPQANE